MGKSAEKRLLPLDGSSPLGFGGWALGGEYWGPQEHKQSVRAVHRALNMGINHFDTAPVYGKGRSEQLLGQQLKKIRQNCLISTKAFYTDPPGLKKSIETSLKRLLTDYIDIFYIHWPLSNTDMRPGMELLEGLRRQGRLRAIGVSNFTVSQIRKVQEACRVDVYQGGYNVLWPRAEREILPFCREQDIPFIPYGVLGQGLLTEEGLEKHRSPHEGHRHKMLLYSPELQAPVEAALKKILTVCRREGWRTEHAVVRYVQEKTATPCVLMGVRSRSQAENNFSLPSRPLPGTIRKALEGSRREISRFLPDEENMFGHKS